MNGSWMVSRWSALSRRNAWYNGGFDQPAINRANRVKGRFARGTRRMDMTWVTGRIAVGGGIWNQENMAAVARAGVTHIIDMQIEFDDTSLAAPFGIEVLWNAVDDDFQLRSPDVFRRGVEFALSVLAERGPELYVQCAPW